ncbi:MAG: diacylglycerol kinase family lipid kinase [Armatimonadota bacterium]|nr:diacylglycerol kinase family lipid kinase [bacterium]MDW8321561.1 diacylglycerol kinase family lipid kinase [Armatimonadota bacterium]
MTSADIVVVLNPKAGRYRANRHHDTLQNLLEQVSRRAGLSWRVVHTTRPGQATELARQAAEAGASIVVAAGGDGTCGEVANGIVGTSARLGVLPLGTGNDFARCAGISENLQIAVETLFTGKARRIDLGSAGGRYFINIAGCGMDAAVAKRVNQGFRFLQGTAAYVAALFQTLATFKPVRMCINTDGQEQRIDAFLCTVANTQSYGGGMRIAPFAQIDDGLLDVCIVKAVSKLEFVRVFPRVYSGTHITHPCFLMHTARKIYVESDPPVPILVDGDVVGTTPVEFSIHPHAIEVILPAK